MNLAQPFPIYRVTAYYLILKGNFKNHDQGSVLKNISGGSEGRWPLVARREKRCFSRVFGLEVKVVDKTRK